MPKRLTPAKISLLYAGFAVLWIIASGYLLTFTVADPVIQNRIEIGKGLVFVAVTSYLLYLGLKGWRASFDVEMSLCGNLDPPKAVRPLALIAALALIVPLACLALVQISPVYERALWVSVFAFFFSVVLCVVFLQLWYQQQRIYRYALEARCTAAVAESEARFRALFNQAAVGVAQINTVTGEFVRVNRKYCAITGYSLEEMMAMTCTDITEPADLASDLSHIARLKAGELHEFSLEKRYIHKNGQPVWVELTLSPMWEPGAQPDYCIAVVHDITERKRLEEERQETQALFQKIISRLPGVVYQFRLRPDGSFCFPFASEAMRDIYRVDPALVRDDASPVFATLHPDDYDGIVASIEASAQNLTPWHYDYRVRFDDGTVRWLSGNSLPEREADGSMIWHGFITDITERKGVEAKIQRMTNLYAALSQCNQAIVRCATEAELFPQICRDAVQFGGMKMAWIGMIDPDSHWIHPVASFGAGVEYLHELRISVDVDNPFGQGPTGIALRGNEPVWCQDFIHDPRTGPWHEQGRRYGWAASAALPLHRNGMVIGVFTLYADVVNAFDEAERNLLLEMTMDIDYALNNFVQEAARQQIQAALCESEAFNVSVLDSLLQHVAVLDSAGFIVAVNKAWHQFAEQNGAPDSALNSHGVNYLDVCVTAPNYVLDKEVAEVRQGIMAVLAGASPEFSMEYPCHSPTERRWFLMHVSPLQGARRGAVVVHENITSRKLAELSFQESEQRLRTIIENEPECVKIVDAAGHLLDMNRAGLAMLEADSLEAVQQHGLVNFLLPAYRKPFVDLHQRTLQGQSGVLEFEIISLKGRPRWLETHYAPLRSEADGKIELLLGVTRDITVRKQAEIALGASEQRYRSLFENMISGYAYCQMQYDAGGQPVDFVYLDVNNAFTRITGLDDVVGKPVSVVIPGLKELSPELFEIYGRVAATGVPEVFEFDFKPNNQWLIISVYCPEPGFFVAVFDDITERKLAEAALRESESRFRVVFEQAAVGVAQVETASNRCVRINQKYCDILGYTRKEMQGADFIELTHPDDVALDRFYKERLNAGKISEFTLEKRYFCKDGSTKWVSLTVSPMWVSGASPDYHIAIVFDITERKQAETQLKLTSKVFEQSGEGFMITDADRNILTVNRAFTAITGYSESDVRGMQPSLLGSGLHDDSFYQQMWESILTQGHWQGEIWNRRKNGDIFPELLSISAVTDELGHVSHYVAVFTDMSKLKETESQLEYLAHHDSLTRLPNRLLLFYRLKHAIDLALREGKQMALMMLDLDHFKNINDSFGHLAGDELLQQVAERLMGRLRKADTVARLGGDEFTVLLEDISAPEDAGRLAKSIIADLSESYQLSQWGDVRIGVSVGISLYPQHADTPEMLLQQADTALYLAKAQGRGRYAYFSDELTIAARTRIELEARLRKAIAQNELCVYYQPQVDIVSGCIVGAEALVRWQDPTEGLIPPARFIPLAEDTGLIIPVGAWVLRETCRQGKQWLDEGLPPLILAVNVSPHQFIQSDVGELVSEVLAETGFPARYLELELTESGLMEREEEAVDILNKLRNQGVRLAIDDFGTGYSSLAYLKRFPLDVLKIDKSFIDDIPHDNDDMEIAASIIAMGHILGFKVLAEGVETLPQLAFLQGKGCDLYQGYLKSKPLPAAAFVQLLRG
ncbi:MAG: PAS domain S-box protein [Methylovulum sp.]|nr:PAS domain S-box protein [Methylovulum sp.]